MLEDVHATFTHLHLNHLPMRELRDRSETIKRCGVKLGANLPLPSLKPPGASEASQVSSGRKYLPVCLGSLTSGSF